MAKKAHASHILLKSKGEASQLIQNIKSLKDFERYARKKSTCPSGRKGGDLGWFGKKQMVKEFEKAAFEQDLGQVGEPVQTDFGYHLIWVHARK